MIELSVKWNRREMRKLARTIQHIPRGLSRATLRSVSKTLTGVRTDSVNEIRRVVNLKAKTVRATMTLVRPSMARPWGILRCRGKRMSLGKYGARQTRKGVTVEVFKKRGRFLIPRAYIWKGNVWRRHWAGEKRARHRARKFKKKIPYGKLPREYRLPIYRMTGPGVPFVLNRPAVLFAIQRKAQARLNKNFAHEVKYLLSKAA